MNMASGRHNLLKTPGISFTANTLRQLFSDSSQEL